MRSASSEAVPRLGAEAGGWAEAAVAELSAGPDALADAALASALGAAPAVTAASTGGGGATADAATECGATEESRPPAQLGGHAAEAPVSILVIDDRFV